MTDMTVLIEPLGWRVRFLTDFTCLHIDRAIDALIISGCRGDKLQSAFRNLVECIPDTGLAYSNPARRETVLVAYRATSLGQLLNTLSHETAHVRDHIAAATGADPTSEEMCYLQGDLMGTQDKAVENWLAKTLNQLSLCKM